MYISGVSDTKDLIKELAEVYEDLENTNKILREKNNKLEDEHYKDELVAQLKKRNEILFNDMLRGFRINEDEEKEWKTWEQNHIINQHGKGFTGGAIGGGFKFEFLPTSIGTIGTIKCTSCASKAEKEAYETEPSYKEYKNNLVKYYNKYDAMHVFQDEL